MRFELFWFVTLLALSPRQSYAQTAQARVGVSHACFETNRNVLDQGIDGSAIEIERLASAITDDQGRPDYLCTGLILHNVALRMSGSGRSVEAEALARRSVETLEKSHSAEDPVLFWPLQVLATAQFEQRKIASASQTLRKVRNVREQGPDERAAVSTLSAALLAAQGRYHDAEQEYMSAFRFWQAAGHGYTADAAAAHSALAVLYLDENRLEEAKAAIDHALNIFNSSKDTVPVDQLKLLNSLGVLHGRKGEWREAERDLREAVSIASSKPCVNVLFTATLLNNYALALRKNHKRREASVIEARLKAFQPEVAQGSAVVDISELLAKSGSGYR